MTAKPIVTVNLWYDRAVMRRRRSSACRAGRCSGCSTSGACSASRRRTCRSSPAAPTRWRRSTTADARCAGGARSGRRDSRRARRAPRPRHRHPREARDVLGGAGPAAAPGRHDPGRAASFSPATGSTPDYRRQSRARRRAAIAPLASTIERVSDERREPRRAVKSASPAIRMKSIVVHYQEIALKGKNRPWFIARLSRNIREAVRGPRRRRACTSLMGRIEVVLGPATSWDAVRDRLSTVFGIANFARAARVTLDVDDDRGGDPQGPRPREPADVPRLGAARRQALSADVAADRARGRRPHQGSARLDRRISTSRR